MDKERFSSMVLNFSLNLADTALCGAKDAFAN